MNHSKFAFIGSFLESLQAWCSGKYMSFLYVLIHWLLLNPNWLQAFIWAGVLSLTHISLYFVFCWYVLLSNNPKKLVSTFLFFGKITSLGRYFVKWKWMYMITFYFSQWLVHRSVKPAVLRAFHLVQKIHWEEILWSYSQHIKGNYCSSSSWLWRSY